MKKFLLTLAALPLFIISLFGQDKVAAEYVKDQLIVKFKQERKANFTVTSDGIIQFGITSLDLLNASHQCTSAEALFKINSLPASLQNVFILTFKTEKDIPSLADQYLATELFEYTHPNYIGHPDGGTQEINLTPNEPPAKFKLQWGLYNDGSFTYANGKTPKVGADINIKPAWDITTGDVNTIVAVIDGGINKTHSEFSGRLWTNPKEIAGNGVDDDSNGFIDDINGWNFHTNNNDIADANGHGTNVASIIGATGNNGVGIAGINWKCKLMILNNYKASVSGFPADVITNAITYAADNGAKVINMSLGFTNCNIPAMQAAIDYAYGKKVLVVTSMGNGNVGTAQAPACMNHVMAIGATNVDDSRCVPFGAGGTPSSLGSNYGSYISAVAPGNWIIGCIKSGTDTYDVYANTWNGTSQSCPMATGIASLIYAINPSFHPDSVKRYMEMTAADQVGVPSEDVKGWDQYMGWGRLDAYKAVKQAQIATGIFNVVANSSTVKIYPNPFKNVAYFSFSAIPGTSHTIILTDVLGKEVKRVKDNKNLIEISREGLKDGLYFYKTTSGDNVINSGKIIVSD